MKVINQKGFSAFEVVLLIVVVCLIGLGALLVHQHTKPSDGQTSSSSGVGSSLQPPTVPTNHAYLGAFVNPAHSGAGNGEPGSNVIQQLPAFNQLVGKHLSIIHFYAQFKAPLPVSTLDAIESNGSTPMISWGCTNVSAIASGQYDSTINAYADGLKSFGKPVFLRWYWEMNQQNADGATPAGSGCAGYNNGPGYIAAWQHIYKLFQADGATNVAFVWCPGSSGGNFATYYPGDASVNWIGLDRYERTQNNQPLLSFSGMFSSYYNEWASHHKPMIIAETAAMGDTDQAQYLSDIQNQAPNYPDIKAFVYFDATGPAGDWSIKGQGVVAFQSLANSAYFSN